jgi:hypothetical protein
MRRALRGRPGRVAVLIVLLFLFVGAAPPAAAEETAPPSLKAAFLLNFAKFAEWPREGAAAGPLTLCVLRDRASEDALAQLADGSSINGRSVVVARATTPDRLQGCHLLYLVGNDPTSLGPILADLRTRPVLTVGDGELFVRQGGIVGLVVGGQKVRFAISPGAAQRSGLRLSSKLLALAILIHD